MEHHPSITVTESNDVIIDIQCDGKTISETEVSSQTNVRSAFKTKSTTMIVYVLIAAALIGGIVFGVHSEINNSGSDVPRDDTSTLLRDVNPRDEDSPAKERSTQHQGEQRPKASEPVTESSKDDEGEGEGTEFHDCLDD